jgi:hypothetical protein
MFHCAAHAAGNCQFVDIGLKKVIALLLTESQLATTGTPGTQGLREAVVNIA